MYKEKKKLKSSNYSPTSLSILKNEVFNLKTIEF